MSYARMDHAAWMETNNKAINRRLSKRGKKLLPESLTDFQAKVIDIVGMVGCGIYNAPICEPTSIIWDYGWSGLSLTWNEEMATWDFNELSMLVFLCHEARIRCSIEAVAPKRMRLCFWQRKSAGDIAIRHPNLDEAVAMFKEYLPAGHRIIYKGPDGAPCE